MDISKTIPKLLTDPSGLDFDSLKASGIDLLQDICGKTWTDYNLHDPGITILEQLCYALTEINYRNEFPMADMLAGEGGGINFEKQALYRPQDILPSQPVTIDDYRKLIIDQVPGIDNVWFRTERKKGTRSAGLYWVYVRLRDPVSDSLRYNPDWILQRVKEVYAANRNLCEDLQEVRIVSKRQYSLQGKVELEGARPPDEVLAEIYFRCAHFMAQSIEFKPYEDLIAKGTSLEELFEGPLSIHGHIENAQLHHSNETISVVDMVGIISRIDGVKHVEQISFLDDKGEQVDSLSTGEFLKDVPYLVYPATDQDITVHLYKRGQEYPVTSHNLKFKLDKLHAEYLSIKRSATDLEELCDLPEGMYRPIGTYYSIQHQFPGIYGINAYGVPESDPPARKAQARQLKAYLLFFEQILANGLMQLQQAQSLFSTDEDLKQSYFSQVLDKDKVPNIDAIYSLPKDERQVQVSKLLSAWDDFDDRRNRVLDHLLGLYGEDFSQHSLRRFSEYINEEKLSDELIRNKLRFLKSMVELSGRRAIAFNYMEAPDNEANHTVLLSKLSILLGFQNVYGGAPTTALRDKGLKIVEEGAQGFQGFQLTEAEAGALHLIPPKVTGSTDEPQLYAEIDFLKKGHLHKSILRFGTNMDSYRIKLAEGGREFQLLLRADETGIWHSIGKCANRDQAIQLAHSLRDFLLHLNEQSERILMVEHLLLRPHSGRPFKIKVDARFFAFRLTLVLPAWTSRCRDLKFRQLVEESVSLNCSAHIQPAILWLDFHVMAEFEGLYGEWLVALRHSSANPRVIDLAAERLIAFLLLQERKR